MELAGMLAAGATVSTVPVLRGIVGALAAIIIIQLLLICRGGRL